MSSPNPRRLDALDIVFRRPGHRTDRNHCQALQHVIQLLGADRDESRAALALFAIVNEPLLSAPIAATMPVPVDAARAEKPAVASPLMDLLWEQELAWLRLATADEIRDVRRRAQAMEEARANIQRIETAIEAEKRRLSA